MRAIVEWEVRELRNHGHGRQQCGDCRGEKVKRGLNTNGKIQYFFKRKKGSKFYFLSFKKLFKGKTFILVLFNN